MLKFVLISRMSVRTFIYHHRTATPTFFVSIIPSFGPSTVLLFLSSLPVETETFESFQIVRTLLDYAFVVSIAVFIDFRRLI